MKSAPKLLLVLVFSDFDEEPLVLVLKNKLEWFWTSSPILQECKISVLVLGIVLQKKKNPNFSFGSKNQIQHGSE